MWEAFHNHLWAGMVSGFAECSNPDYFLPKKLQLIFCITGCGTTMRLLLCHSLVRPVMLLNK
jgi:hypothetical protein